MRDVLNPNRLKHKPEPTHKPEHVPMEAEARDEVRKARRRARGLDPEGESDDEENTHQGYTQCIQRLTLFGTIIGHSESRRRS